MMGTENECVVFAPGVVFFLFVCFLGVDFFGLLNKTYMTMHVLGI